IQSETSRKWVTTVYISTLYKAKLLANGLLPLTYHPCRVTTAYISTLYKAKLLANGLPLLTQSETSHKWVTTAYISSLYQQYKAKILANGQ
ncbi:485_t:CDS:1, partial [Gigaspora rosea]